MAFRPTHRGQSCDNGWNVYKGAAHYGAALLAARELAVSAVPRLNDGASRSPTHVLC